MTHLTVARLLLLVFLLTHTVLGCASYPAESPEGLGATGVVYFTTLEGDLHQLDFETYPSRGSLPERVEIRPPGSRLYNPSFWNMRSCLVFAVNPALDHKHGFGVASLALTDNALEELPGMLPEGTAVFSVSPSGEEVAFLSGGNLVVKPISTQDETVLATDAWIENLGLEWLSNEHIVYNNVKRRSVILWLSTMPLGLRDKRSLPGATLYCARPASEGVAAVCEQDGTVYAFQVESLGLRPIAQLPANSLGRLVASPDGLFLLYSHLESRQPWLLPQENASTFLFSLRTGEERRVLPYGHLDGGAWVASQDRPFLRAGPP